MRKLRAEHTMRFLIPSYYSHATVAPELATQNTTDAETMSDPNVGTPVQTLETTATHGTDMVQLAQHAKLLDKQADDIRSCMTNMYIAAGMHLLHPAQRASTCGVCDACGTLDSAISATNLRLADGFAPGTFVCQFVCLKCHTSSTRPPTPDVS